MFKNSFSFKGRIRRKEYGLTLLAAVFGLVLIALLNVLLMNVGGSFWYTENIQNYSNYYYSYTQVIKTPTTFTNVVFLGLLVMLNWFYLAQGAKRCHDMGNNGWFQVIPFYHFFMLFTRGRSEKNKYGNNPKSK